MNKVLKRAAIAIPVLAAAAYYIPIAAAIWLVCGIIDVMRNKGRTPLLYNRYFFGNGVPTWLLSPFNLLVDLISYRNPGVYALDDFPPAYASLQTLTPSSKRAGAACMCTAGTGSALSTMFPS
jgi:aspartyl/asparaginyl beta-hydroxylase (cupin superfamily)